MCLVYFSKNSKVQKRGKVNLIGRLQLSTEKAKQEENDGIVALRILRIQVRENSSGYASSLSWQLSAMFTFQDGTDGELSNQALERLYSPPCAVNMASNSYIHLWKV